MNIFGNKILTPRLRLRKIEETDLPLVARWSNSTAAHGNYLTPEQMDKETIKGGLQCGLFWNDMNKTFLIELRNATPIGTIHYWIRSEMLDCAVIALKIATPEIRNKGYGTEAQKYLVSQLFNRTQIHRIEMYTDINNTPQQRCLQKLGFELVDSLAYQDHQVHRTGHLFRITRQNFTTHALYHYHYE